MSGSGQRQPFLSPRCLPDSVTERGALPYGDRTDARGGDQRATLTSASPCRRSSWAPFGSAIEARAAVTRARYSSISWPCRFAVGSTPPAADRASQTVTGCQETRRQADLRCGCARSASRPVGEVGWHPASRRRRQSGPSRRIGQRSPAALVSATSRMPKQETERRVLSPVRACSGPKSCRPWPPRAGRCRLEQGEKEACERQ